MSRSWRIALYILMALAIANGIANLGDHIRGRHFNRLTETRGQVMKFLTEKVREHGLSPADEMKLEALEKAAELQGSNP